MTVSTVRRFVAPSSSRLAVLLVLSLSGTLGCSRFGAVYPPRPASTPAPPVADPSPSRLVVHISVTRGAVERALEGAILLGGDGDFALLGSSRHYTWSRAPISLRFAEGRLVVGIHADVRVPLPLRTMDLPFDVVVTAEPVVNGDYVVKLQSIEAKVSSSARSVALANSVTGILDILERQVRGELEHFAYDARPFVADAYARITEPVHLPVGDATACAKVKVLGVEAGPTVIADGLEKDLALVVLPEVTFPCPADDPSLPPPGLPRLANVAALPSGPFTLTIPIAASYDELARAMTVAFTGGKLFFSKQYGGLYLEEPELYESQGFVVLKLHLKGPVRAMGFDTDLDGDIFFSGHVTVSDNELSIPDLEPTVETTNLLLSLKAATGAALIRDQARAALRLDLSDRLKRVRESLTSELTLGGKDACVHGDLDKIEVASVYPHGSYLRVYVNVMGRAEATMPCATPLEQGQRP